MNRMGDMGRVASYELYQTIIEKLNITLARYKYLNEIKACGEAFEKLDLAIGSRDAQINHLLSISICLLKNVPKSTLLEQIFINFMQDYMHLVNQDLQPYKGQYYLSDEFIRKWRNRQIFQQFPGIRLQ